MTIEEIRTLVLGADPTAERYESSRAGSDSYTTWRELRRLPATADGEHIEGWSFQVDRFTRDEDDATAAALFATLDGCERVAVAYDTDYEPDTGYIHHIYDCEGF